MNAAALLYICVTYYMHPGAFFYSQAVCKELDAIAELMHTNEEDSDQVNDVMDAKTWKL